MKDIQNELHNKVLEKYNNTILEFEKTLNEVEIKEFKSYCNNVIRFYGNKKNISDNKIISMVESTENLDSDLPVNELRTSIALYTIYHNIKENRIFNNQSAPLDNPNIDFSGIERQVTDL